ncbi:MAG TPA: glutaredoxin family protein [Burkholderiales bacterium]|nr:glutaredoxin family protein [Burkholderiales bacterium]
MKAWMWTSLLALACTAAHADLYRWVDENGKVQYSDQPPPADARQIEKKKLSGGKASDAPMPYSLQQAVKNFPVTLYTSQCGPACTQASALLARRGVPYSEVDATDATAQVELKKLTGGAIEVPVLKIGRDTVRGFEEGKWNGALDAAGYPQTALVAPRPPAKPKPAATATPPAPPAEKAPAPAAEAAR